MDTLQPDNPDNRIDPDLSILCDVQLLEGLDALPSLADVENLGLRAELRLQTRLLGVEEAIPPLLIILRDGAVAVLESGAGSALWDALKVVIRRLRPTRSAPVVPPAQEKPVLPLSPTAPVAGAAPVLLTAETEARFTMIVGPLRSRIVIDIPDVDCMPLPQFLATIACQVGSSPHDGGSDSGQDQI